MGFVSVSLCLVHIGSHAFLPLFPVARVAYPSVLLIRQRLSPFTHFCIPHHMFIHNFAILTPSIIPSLIAFLSSLRFVYNTPLFTSIITPCYSLSCLFILFSTTCMNASMDHRLFSFLFFSFHQLYPFPFRFLFSYFQPLFSPFLFLLFSFFFDCVLFFSNFFLHFVFILFSFSPRSSLSGGSVVSPVRDSITALWASLLYMGARPTLYRNSRSCPHHVSPSIECSSCYSSPKYLSPFISYLSISHFL